MWLRSRLQRWLPHSLWQQMLLLLLVAIALTSATTARPYHSYFRAQFDDQMEKRGRAIVQTLAKDYELRPAISLRDASQAEPILRAIAASDEEIVYLAVLKGEELVAGASNKLSPQALREALGPLSAPTLSVVLNHGTLLRFAAPVHTERSLAFMDLPAETAPAATSELGYVVLGMSSQKAHTRALWQTLFSIGTTSLGIFTLLSLFYFRWVARRLHRMVNYAQATAAGDTKAELADPIADDLGRLAFALHHSATELQKVNAGLEVTVAARTTELRSTLQHLWSEMDLARKIQTVLLPAPQLYGNCYDVAGLMKPADEVGGDYFDAIEADGKLWLLIGDVSGHGVSAGLIMMMVQTAVRALLERHAAEQQALSPAQLLTLVNRAVWRNLQLIGKGQYITMTVLCIDETGVTYAGLHQHILVFRRATSVVDQIETQGCWIALLDEIEDLNQDRHLAFATGDVLMLYTDGLIEAKRRADQSSMLGLPAVLERFAAACATDQPSLAIAHSVITETNECVVTDDVAVLTMRRVA